MMQDIELDSESEIDDDNEKGKEEEDNGHFIQDFYRNCINESFIKFQQLDNMDDWVLYDNYTDKMIIYTKSNHKLLKIEAFLNCSAVNVFKMFADDSFQTRSQWDNGIIFKLIDIECREQFENIKLIQSVWRFPLLHDRNLLGLQCSTYNNVQKTYMILFTPCEHDIYTKESTQEICNVSYSIWIKYIDSNNCFVSLVVDLRQENAYVPFLMKSKLIHELSLRVLNYEKVYNFDEIYSQWDCNVCKKSNDCYLLECRYCTIPRYWKCGKIGCKRSQPKINNTNNVCIFCNHKVVFK